MGRCELYYYTWLKGVIALFYWEDFIKKYFGGEAEMLDGRWLVYGILCHFQQYFSYVLAVSFIVGGNRSIRRKPPTCRKSLTNFITYCCIKYTLPWTGLGLTTLVVIGTECTGSCKFNYHTITTTAPENIRIFHHKVFGGREDET